MAELFDKKYWEENIKTPTWYYDSIDVKNGLLEIRKRDYDAYKKERDLFYDFFEEHLNEGDISLGQSGPDWDQARKEIDSIAIHHTSMAPGLSKERLSAIELIRLYAIYYAHPTYEADKQIEGKAIYSNHFREGQQVFWPYHWIIRKGGEAERLLTDSEVGWHAGNWDFNCRSVAIVFDDDLEESRPGGMELRAAAKIIREAYPNIRKDRIFGHREINKSSICPSNLFLDTPQKKGWKSDLLDLI